MIENRKSDGETASKPDSTILFSHITTVIRMKSYQLMNMVGKKSTLDYLNNATLLKEKKEADKVKKKATHMPLPLKNSTRDH